MMKSFVDHAQHFVTYYQSATARTLHLFGIPLLLFSFMIGLGFIHLVVPGWFDVSLALLGTFALLAYYFRLYWRLALPITPVLLILLWIANFFSAGGPRPLGLWVFFLSLMVGLILLGIGYYLEGKQPEKHNLWLWAITPLLIVASGIFKLGRLQWLQDEIYGEENK